MTRKPDDFFSADSGGLKALTLHNAVTDMGPIEPDNMGRLHHFTDGVWQPGGERIVTKRVAELLGDKFRPTYANTVTDMLAARDAFLSDESYDADFLNLPNGLLDWRDEELYPHQPNVPTVNQMPVRWNPDAFCPAIRKWLGEVFESDTLALAEEIAGYCLYAGQPIHKAVLLYGSGRNGKGTFLRLLRSLVGEANATTVTPQALDTNRFQAAKLRGKTANIVGDVDPRAFESTEIFKMVTGGDPVPAERKHGQPFEFRSRATTVAAFNRLPESTDATEGFMSRWVVLRFNGYFPAEDSRTSHDKLAELTTREELEGFLVLAVRGLQRLMSRGDFEQPESVREATAEFRHHADPVRAFLAERCHAEKGSYTPCPAVTLAYNSWAVENGHAEMSTQTLKGRILDAARDALGAEVDVRSSKGYPRYRGLVVAGDER